ncbi:MAG: hypothetical protein A2268_15585 [Candidatus Raymondbacteria bacterium RifOxyA12_full_50_37]|uniref:Uncharacterized protein n=1 Tax=Candidatus Raymondbacteria bacterium RIFOXYD12_FULL_49_13 TaxID=1817890 RepID=A0A1F7FIJ9_UNCRA|nr:MAG: hypothetical protein A2268_15585 [Candidatus Raymondbacteria bacterium RifOxyA12_full_50_37]OGJ86114.1 MAG: hypothetical protein A2248_22185 [Candidatus Raymondbacteria bacterium RIFOXYA2_FULL_49_16]OGJ86471.1 MAG: hypothetical protein A2350_20540 [Candidatus Raymondbacteria bacterium RifOxyB12_full_50_8]OGJ95990.1 MAG: hypothetical protein A2453_05135 [Candidatus Raymondbacteria bacterium RIFOXYC2_FULL_50_21]OGK05614.1 MAG: hypothetical protein A2487_18385 [Candidatus Raymondbacteria b
MFFEYIDYCNEFRGKQIRRIGTNHIDFHDNKRNGGGNERGVPVVPGQHLPPAYHSKHRSSYQFTCIDQGQELTLAG